MRLKHTHLRIALGLYAAAFAIYAYGKVFIGTFSLSGDVRSDHIALIIELIFFGLAGGFLASVFSPLSGLSILGLSQFLAMMLADQYGLGPNYYPANFYDDVLIISIVIFVTYDLIAAAPSWKRIWATLGKWHQTEWR